MNRFVAASAVPLIAALPALAQQAPIDPTPQTVLVTATKSLGSPDTADATAQIQRTAGGVEVVPDTAFKNGPANTIKDVLGWVPGVFTSEPRYGDDARVSIRGSGLSRPYGNRGVNMFMDGIPINTSDGLVDLFEIDPTAYRYVEVFKGANAMRYGANSLGGAINFVTPTGRDATSFDGRLDAGSFGYQKAQASTGGASGQADWFVTAAEQGFDGYRAHSNGHQERASANVGMRFSPDAETRFYLNVNSIRQHMPGELDEATALDAPRTANPDFTWKDQQRNIDSWRLANKTTLRWGPTTLDVGFYGIHRHVDHPNWSYLDYTVDDFGGFARVTDERVIGGHANRLVAGVNILDGRIDSQSWWYANSGPYGSYQTPTPGSVAGAVKGTLASSTLDKPKNTAVYLDDAFTIVPQLTLNAGAQFQHAERPRENRLDESQSGRLSFDNVSPKLGALWNLASTAQAFANLSRSAEAPSYDVNPTVTASSPLRAQTATTLEIGTRGHGARGDWDVSVYRARIHNELQCVSTYPGSCNWVNADRTVHQGIEAGGGVELVPSMLARGDDLRLNATYTFNDFRFEGDPTYGNNRLAGVPTHLLRAELLWSHPSGVHAGPNVEWMPKSYFADNANTTAVKPYAVLNFRVGYEPPHGGWSGYVEGRNLADRRYIAVVDAAGSATPESQIFYPGTGRSLNGGVRFKW